MRIAAYEEFSAFKISKAKERSCVKALQLRVQCLKVSREPTWESYKQEEWSALVFGSWSQWRLEHHRADSFLDRIFQRVHVLNCRRCARNSWLFWDYLKEVCATPRGSCFKGPKTSKYWLERRAPSQFIDGKKVNTISETASLTSSHWKERGTSSSEVCSCWSWLNKKSKVLTQMTHSFNPVIHSTIL